MARRKKSKLKKSINKLIYLIILFVMLSIASLFIAPSEEEYLQQQQTSTVQSQYIENLELPKPIQGEQIVHHTGYTLSYNEEYEQPSYVAYKLTQNELYGPNERKNNFREDPSIKTGSATLDDYKNSGYDRGHLCPAADQKESEQAMSDSFYMSNMSPQNPDFNRGIWADLEGTVRNFADTNDMIYVVTGPVLTDGPYKTIGKNKVAVPKFYYKVILDYTEPELKAIGFILPNQKGTSDLQCYVTSVNNVEEITDIDFFYQLPDDIEEKLESSVDVYKWVFKEFIASKGQGSFDESKNQSTTTSSDNKIKDSAMYVLVQIRKETLNIVEKVVPVNVLNNLGIY